TEPFLKEIFQESLMHGHGFSFIQDKKAADIVIKIEADVAHIYAHERYISVEFPLRLDDFIHRLKAFYYQNTDRPLSHGAFHVENDILSFAGHEIILSDMEKLLLKKVLSSPEKSVHKQALYDSLGTGAEAVIYRFRKKIMPYNLDLVLENNMFYLSVVSKD
ncbi:MAG: hypothetical protein AAF621_07820, partial [Pseudomonadota bacterium]